MNKIQIFNQTFESFKKRIELGFTVIPASIRYDQNVNDSLKILYGILVLLNNTYEYVYATNEYLSELLGIPNSTLRENLYKLKKMNYIELKDIDYSRYIRVRNDDLIKYKSKIPIDVSNLDYESLSNFYSLIPGHVLLSSSLTPKEKILYAEIMALTNKYGFAFISNLKLSQLLNISERQLIRCLNSLLKYGFIQYGKDIKSKRLIYVSYHFKKDFKLIEKPTIKYEVIENKNNDVVTIRKLVKNQIYIDPDIDNALDQIYKKMR